MAAPTSVAAAPALALATQQRTVSAEVSAVAEELYHDVIEVQVVQRVAAEVAADAREDRSRLKMVANALASELVARVRLHPHCPRHIVADHAKLYRVALGWLLGG